MNITKRYIAKIYGLVQGIGYRPFIYNTAKEYNIYGWVNNHDSSVVVDIEGTTENIDKFLTKVLKKPPALASIQKIEIRSENTIGYKEFKIEKSQAKGSKYKFLLPDISICEKCTEDILNKNSKRYRYAFTNCTNCGPRYSIIKELPYDRINTTMNKFKMCKDCNDEYTNPQNRRFHAQPNCCFECGPVLKLIDNKGIEVNCEDEIKKTASLLKQGKIIALKGIGGFHIVCDAYNKEAVTKLRDKKHRIHKPLAVMVKNIKVAKELCFINEKEEEVLVSSRKPIVLLNKRIPEALSQNIAPNQNKYGVMLTYTPIHHLLFNEGLYVLVMTSGNISGLPIEYKNNRALKNLNDAVDYFLINNRDINVPIDDSVVKVIENKEMVSRLGRGYAPYCIKKTVKNKILACGGEMKSTFSFSMDGIVYVSQYLGDLKDLDSFKEYKHSLKNMKNILKFEPNCVVYDMHPNYMSTLYGKNQNTLKLEVQHHHAHMVSCMLEHDINETVIGVIYDGIGYGSDHNIWGGEFFVGNRKNFVRKGQFKYVKIQGGDSSQKSIWKTAVSYLNSLENDHIKHKALNRIKKLSKGDVENIVKALNENINCYKCSSVGRLFDAAASLLGIRESITYDSQGAIELENIAADSVYEFYDYAVSCQNNIFNVDCNKIFEGIIEDIDNNVPINIISSRFHNSIVNITEYAVCRIRDESGINKVILSGGVFENEYLLKRIYSKLQKRDFQVYFNNKIPTNDSGISFGQIAVADEILKERR